MPAGSAHLLFDARHRAELIAYAHEFGVFLSEEQASLLLRHLALVIERNGSVNLTRIVSPDDSLIKHVVDSLLFVSAMRGVSGTVPTSFVDVGTGGGFPGIPFGVAADISGLLIDSVSKKTCAVGDFIHKLHLGDLLSVRTVRAEELALQRPSEFGAVIARAVAHSSVLIEYAAPLLAKDGICIISKGAHSEEELDEAERVSGLCGLRIVSRETYLLPRDLGSRTLIVLRKYSDPVVALPRRVGVANKRPL